MTTTISEHRNTPQKLKIKEYLNSTKSHPTAEAVYLIVKKEIPTITLATVYRNLQVLAREREIRRLEVNGEYHFDSDISLHQHGVCLECGRVMDFFNSNISKSALKAVKCGNFSVSAVEILYQGICKDCKESKLHEK